MHRHSRKALALTEWAQQQQQLLLLLLLLRLQEQRLLGWQQLL
jgi:hypothetical protein